MAVGAAEPVESDWRDAYGGWLFTVAFVLVAVLGFVGPLGMGALTAICGLAALPLVRPDRRAWACLGLVAALVLWAVVSMSWSRAAAELPAALTLSGLQKLTAAKLVLQLALYGLLILGATRLSAHGAERALRLFAYALTGLAVILIVEGLSTAQIYQAMQAMIGKTVDPGQAMRNVAQGAYVIALLFWPASLLLRREGRNVLVLALVAGVIGATALFGTDAPALALATGLLALVAVLAFGRGAVLSIMGLAVVYVLGAPWIARAAALGGLFDRLKDPLPASWDQRMDIWTFASARVAERPLQGWGLDASRTFGRDIPLHTHDAAVQIWLELGLPGALLAAAIAAGVFWLIGRAHAQRAFMATATATATAYMTIGAISFGVWQEWWLALGAMAFCACLALKQAMPLWSFEDKREPEA